MKAGNGVVPELTLQEEQRIRWFAFFFFLHAWFIHDSGSLLILHLSGFSDSTFRDPSVSSAETPACYSTWREGRGWLPLYQTNTCLSASFTCPQRLLPCQPANCSHSEPLVRHNIQDDIVDVIRKLGISCFIIFSSLLTTRLRCHAFLLFLSHHFFTTNHNLSVQHCSGVYSVNIGQV